MVELNSDLDAIKTYNVITLSTALTAGSSITLPELTDAMEVVAYSSTTAFVVKQYEPGITVRSATYNTYTPSDANWYHMHHITVDFSTGKVLFAGSKGPSAGEIKITKIYYK